MPSESEMGTEIWERFTIHYTPKHGSWLNQAEIEIGLFARQCLGKRRIPDLKGLRRESRAWNRRMNHDQIKINWQFDRRAARRKFGYKYNSSSGHRTSPARRLSTRSPVNQHRREVLQSVETEVPDSTSHSES